MTPEERANSVLGNGAFGGIVASHQWMIGAYSKAVLEVADAIRSAVEEEAERWREATRHAEGCHFTRSVFVPCSCGCHGRLATLHAERGVAERAARM